MRTTVTLDPDVQELIRDEMHRSRRGFKQTLNAAIRAGLGKRTPADPGRPFTLQARPLGLRPGLDPAGFNKLADELEAEAFVERTRRISES